jgi:acetyltransferase-like isoleucine patch superfamily enzyme
VGSGCIIGTGVFVDESVVVGDNCKLQNGAMLFAGATLADGVFVGPGACLANDRHPRAINLDGSLRSESDWTHGRVDVEYGASIGAGAVVVPDAVVGRWAMVGAGAVVSADVPPHALILGVPGRISGYVCMCGGRLERMTDGRQQCVLCGEHVDIESRSNDGV